MTKQKRRLKGFATWVTQAWLDYKLGIFGSLRMSRTLGPSFVHLSHPLPFPLFSFFFFFSSSFLLRFPFSLSSFPYSKLCFTLYVYLLWYRHRFRLFRKETDTKKIEDIIKIYSFFLIFCWPCISIYLFININQLDALNFLISLFQASTCFEHMSSSSGGQKLYYTLSGIISPIGVMIPETV